MKNTILSLLLALATLPVLATNCPSHYMDGQAPIIFNQKMTAATQEICYEGFGLVHSGITNGPLWSAEHLTRENAVLAKSLSREDSFHPEPALQINGRAELKDFARSGYDRGHMSPNGDMSNRTAQYESFSLANIVPQNANNNRFIWAGLETSTRQLAKSEGQLYIITGPAFLGQNLQKIGNVIVPSHLFKVIYSPTRNQAAAYFVANEATENYEVISVAELEQKIGINLLPGLSQSIKSVAMPLPAPYLRRSNNFGFANPAGSSQNTATHSQYVNAVPAIISTVRLLRNFR